MKSHPMKKKNQLRVSRIRGFGCLFALGLILFGLFDFLVSSPYSGISSIHKARQNEAGNNIGAMNRAQEAYFLEYSEFSDSLQKLGVGIKNPTENYEYSIRVTPLAVFNRATPRKKFNDATPQKKEYLKGHVGAVFIVVGDETTGEVLTVAIACEPQSPTWLSNWFNISRPADPILRDDRIECGPHTKQYGDTKPIVIGKDAVSVYNSLNYAATGQYDQALKIAKSITSEYYRQSTLEQIAHYKNSRKP
jgi:type IV pilus assembly protein PilA